MIAAGQLSFGHAKVLAGLAGNPDRQVKLARKVLAEDLSVRKLEQFVATKTKDAPASKADAPQKPSYVRDIEQQLTEAVGTRVTILPGRKKNTGRIVLEYYSLDDFDRIGQALGLEHPDGK
jgi:ParB family chromosome partitioning protein